jgi:heme exporter protein B
MWALVWKDLQIERHTKQSIGIMLMFGIVAVVTFNFALEVNLGAVREVAGGLLWVTILLAGTLGLNRAFASETENRPIDAILIAPIDRSAIYLGKVISVSLFTLAMELFLIPLFIAFTNKPFYRPQVLLLIALGTIGYVAAGVLVSSMAVQTRANYVLVPVLLLPLTLPVVLAAATGMAQYMGIGVPPFSEVSGTFALVIAYDLLMLAAGIFTYNYVVEE